MKNINTKQISIESNESNILIYFYILIKFTNVANLVFYLINLQVKDLKIKIFHQNFIYLVICFNQGNVTQF